MNHTRAHTSGKRILCALPALDHEGQRLAGGLVIWRACIQAHPPRPRHREGKLNDV
jgi:hypothetical protein